MLIDFAVDYVRCGFSASSLRKRAGELRLFAARRRLPFPAYDSFEWSLVIEVHDALLKLDPIEKVNATPCSMFWIQRILGSMGVRSVDDLRSCHGATALCRPGTSTARLARSCTQPSRELCYSTPLPPPLCDPVRLFCGCEPD